MQPEVTPTSPEIKFKAAKGNLNWWDWSRGCQFTNRLRKMPGDVPFYDRSF